MKKFRTEDWVIIPGTAVGPLDFEMESRDVEDVLGKPDQEINTETTMDAILRVYSNVSVEFEDGLALSEIRLSCINSVIFEIDGKRETVPFAALADWLKKANPADSQKSAEGEFKSSLNGFYFVLSREDLRITYDEFLSDPRYKPIEEPAIEETSDAEYEAGIRLLKTDFKELIGTCYVPEFPKSARSGEESTMTSRFGGIPFLPRGESWPECGECEAPMALLWQLHLAEIKLEGAPEMGWLSYFGCDSCGEIDSELVKWTATDGAVVAKAPPKRTIYSVFPVLKWKKRPDVSEFESLSKSAKEGLKSKFGAAKLAGFRERYEVRFPVVHMKAGGFPKWLQDPMLPQCPDCKNSENLVFLQQLPTGPGAAEGQLSDVWAYVFTCKKHPKRFLSESQYT
jgi:hypothetical protein